MTQHTPIPPRELELFEGLKDIQVVFDVGARADTDYTRLKPWIELHAFEPNPEFFQQLKDALGDRPNTYLNPYGLGDKEEEQGYNNGRQMFLGGEETSELYGDQTLKLRTLDSYVAEHGIERIDFLKIDVEGYDFKVLQGGFNTIPKCHYIQYEYWNDRLQYHGLLEDRFDMLYYGWRNVLCTNRTWS